jgi:hypothetical protein
MGIVCRACNHSNRAGSLSCSNCGNRLQDEFADILRDLKSEPKTLMSKGSGNRPLLIGLVVIGVIVLAIAIGISVHEGPSNGAGDVGVQSPVAVQPTQEQQTRDADEKEQEAFKSAQEQGYAQAEGEQAAFADLRKTISIESPTEVIYGRRIRVSQFMAGMNFLQSVLRSVPKPDYADIVSMYKTIEGYDGSTSTEALERCRSLYVGKYYVLQGDVFQIQADRDYPLDGLNQFSLFGWVNLPPRIAVNVSATSDEKMPPYYMAAMLSRIVDFQLGTNRAGETIVIPVVQILVAASVRQLTSEPGEVVINEPLLIAQLLKSHAAQSETAQ